MVLGYFMLFYFLPTALLAFLEPHPYLVYDGNFLIIAIVITTLLGASFALSATGIRLPTAWARPLPNIFEHTPIVAGLGLLMLPISAKFHADFGSGFRYAAEGLSQSGTVPKLVYLYKAFFYPFIFYFFFKFCASGTLSKKYRALIALHTVNWIMCATGSGDMIWIAIALIMALLGDRGYRILINESVYGQTLLPLLIKRLFIIILLAGIALLIVFFGFANKMGFEEAANRFTGDGALLILNYLYYRISIFIASIEHALSYGAFNLDFYARSFAVLGDMIAYRFEAVLGLAHAAPRFEGMNHLNYFEIYALPANERSGASPGVIGAFLYFPIMPLNLFLCALYLAAVMNSLRRAAPLPGGRTPSMFAMFYLLIASYSLLHSPFEAFFKIGPELLTTLMFLYCFEKASLRAPIWVRRYQARMSSNSQNKRALAVAPTLQKNQDRWHGNA